MYNLLLSEKTKKSYFLLPVFNQKRILQAGRLPRPHKHPVYHFMFTISGYGSVESERGVHPQKAGDIYVVQPFEKHIFRTEDDDWEYYTFNFILIEESKLFLNYPKLERKLEYLIDSNDRKNVERRSIDDLFELTIVNGYVEYPSQQWKSIIETIDRFCHYNQEMDNINFKKMTEYFKDWYDRFANFQNSANYFFSRLVNEYFSARPNKDSEDRLVAKVHQFCNKYFRHKFDLKVMAEDLDYSASYLSSRFKALTGQTINDYYNFQKMRRASLILANEKIPVSDIASSFGFSSSQQFSKLFKKHMKFSPSSYRAKFYIE